MLKSTFSFIPRATSIPRRTFSPCFHHSFPFISCTSCISHQSVSIGVYRTEMYSSFRFVRNFFSSSFAQRIGVSVLIGLGALATYFGSLVFLQDKIIYLPRSYSHKMHGDYYVKRLNEKNIQTLKFNTSQGSQTAFFVQSPDTASKRTPRNTITATEGADTPTNSASHSHSQASSSVLLDDGRPLRIWLMFGGNAALALDWIDFIYEFYHFRLMQSEGESAESLSQTPHIAFLLVDYPAYGFCQGRPSPSTILDTTREAVNACVRHLQISEDQLNKGKVEFALFGHSLGAASAIQYAHASMSANLKKLDSSSSLSLSSSSSASTEVSPVFHRMILLSPFTSMMDMVYALVGPLPFLSLLLRHPFDNRRLLLSILFLLHDNPQFGPFRVDILHGTLDSIVPVRMGRELGQLLSEKSAINAADLAAATTSTTSLSTISGSVGLTEEERKKWLEVLKNLNLKEGAGKELIDIRYSEYSSAEHNDIASIASRKLFYLLSSL